MIVLSRQVLFEDAWLRPLTEVASELGITSTALKKICDRHDIPTPGRGYWARLKAGERFPRPRLRPASTAALEQVEIKGARLIPAAKQAVAAVEKAAEAMPAPTAPAADEGAARRAELEATRRAVVRAKADEEGFVTVGGRGVVRLRLSPTSVERGLAWLDRLLEVGAAKGWQLEAAEAGAALRVGEDAVVIRLEEKPDRTPHVPTEKERADQARWGWAPRQRHDQSPSGRLSLSIEENSYSGLRRTFSETKTRALGDLTEEVVEAVATHAELKKKRRLDAEEARRLAAIAEAQRRRVEAFERRETRRMEFVNVVVVALDERDKLLSVREHLDAAGSMGEDDFPALRDWIERRLRQAEALVSPRFLEFSARSAKLEFDEAKVDTKDGSQGWYYGRDAHLEFWSVDEAADRARSQSPLEWAEEQGLMAVGECEPTASGAA